MHLDDRQNKITFLMSCKDRQILTWFVWIFLLFWYLAGVSATLTIKTLTIKRHPSIFQNALSYAQYRVIHIYIYIYTSHGNFFRVTGQLCGEFTGPRWIPRTTASDVELWRFLWSWINGWVNNREAGYLRRHCAHYDVAVMIESLWDFTWGLWLDTDFYS